VHLKSCARKHTIIHVLTDKHANKETYTARGNCISQLMFFLKKRLQSKRYSLYVVSTKSLSPHRPSPKPQLFLSFLLYGMQYFTCKLGLCALHLGKCRGILPYLLLYYISHPELINPMYIQGVPYVRCCKEKH
jgi:hypothetical protein